jgi:CDP-diacylglycerol--glycerol-3-phosphate 3-phosphatidyltransferase
MKNSKLKKAKKKIDKTSKEVRKEVLLNVPNSITILRLIFTFVLVYLIWINYNFIFTGILFLLIASTDTLDGYLARKLNQTTKIGAKLDQYIDRIFMIPIILILLYKFYNINFTFFYVLIFCLSREIVATPGVIIRFFRGNYFYGVKYIGKVTTFLQSIAVAAFIFRFDFAIYLGIITGFVGIVSGLDYLRNSLE